MARFVLLLAFAVTFFAVAHGYYKCDRNGQDCKNGGTCDLTAGTCTCLAANNDTLSFDCSLVNAEKSQGTCNPVCANGGACFNSVCKCPSTHYGASCEFKRIDVSCTTNGMTVNLNVKGFVGKAIVKDQTKTECEAKALPEGSPPTEATINAAWAGLYFYFANTDTTCGNVETDTSTQPPSNIRRFKMRFINGNVDSPGDIDIKATCGTGDVITSQVTITTTNPTRDDLSKVNIGTTKATVVFVAKTKSDGLAYVPGTVQKLGVVLILEFTLDPTGTDYIVIRLETLTSMSATDENTAKKLELVKNGCTQSSVNAIVVVKPTRVDSTDKKVVKAEVKVHKFEGATILVFAATVKACTSTNEAECAAPTTCNTEFGRKKRAAGDGPKGIAQLRRVISVGDPKATDQSRTGSNNTEKTCTVSKEITAAVAALAVAVVVMMILCIVLVVFLSRRPKVTYKESMCAMPPSQLPKLVNCNY